MEQSSRRAHEGLFKLPLPAQGSVAQLRVDELHVGGSIPSHIIE